MNLHSPIIFYNKLWKVKLKWQWQAKLLTKEVFWVNDSYCQALKCVSDSEQIDFDGWYWFSKKSMDILAMSAEAAPMNLSPLAFELSLGILRQKWILELSLSYSTCSCAPVTSQVCLLEGSDYNFIPVFLKPVLFSAPAVQCGVLYCPRPRQGDMLGLLSQCLALNKWTCNIVWGFEQAVN